MCRCPSAHHRTAGFTLIELLIVVVLVALLSALAWPMFTDAVHRSRRADAVSALSKIQQAQERWRANNPTYQTTLANLTGAQQTTSPDQHYSLTLESSGLDSKVAYAARASVRQTSPQHGDSRCQWMQVTVNGGSIVYTSSSSASAPGATDPCWVR
jgi:type IV pilus assembly protein PilE